DLEAEPGLEGNSAASQRTCVLAEVRGGDVTADASGIEVQDVEEIEDVGADLDRSALAGDAVVREAEAFGQGGVNVSIARTDEGIANQSGRRRRREVRAGESGAAGRLNCGVVVRRGEVLVGVLDGGS